ncbi:hypothetical protein [Oenococcus sp.]
MKIIPKLESLTELFNVLVEQAKTNNSPEIIHEISELSETIIHLQNTFK